MTAMDVSYNDTQHQVLNPSPSTSVTGDVTANDNAIPVTGREEQQSGALGESDDIRAPVTLVSSDDKQFSVAAASMTDCEIALTTSVTPDDNSVPVDETGVS